MSGYQTIQRIKHIEEIIDRLGFRFAKPKHGDWERTEQSLSLVPKDPDALPVYSRDAELYVGSLEQLETWLAGLRWAREYDMLLRLSDDGKRSAAEQKERNRQLMQTLKQGRGAEGIE